MSSGQEVIFNSFNMSQKHIIYQVPVVPIPARLTFNFQIC